MRVRKNEINTEERTQLAEELAGLKAEVKALRAERSQASNLASMEREVEKLRLEKGRLVEENDRKIRETEHKVGLLKLKQDHEVANAKRETQLEIREGNLSADKDRFKAEMEFQRAHLQREVERIETILGKVLDRLPNIEASLSVKRTDMPAKDDD